MNNYSWPEDEKLGERARLAWATTTAVLSIGTHVTGDVIGRQPFGVFIRVDGVTDAVGLAEISTMPRGTELPALGSRVAAEVIGHREHNHQVQLRLKVSTENNQGSAPDPGTASEISRGGPVRHLRSI